MKRIRFEHLFRLFAIPVIVLIAIITSLFLKNIFHLSTVANVILFVGIIVGSFELVQDTVTALFHKKFALDYIAILAISVGILSGQYIVASIIVLMLAGGNTLEKFGMDQAKASLTSLTDRIPNSVTLWEKNQMGKTTTIESVLVGQIILIRRGEVIPLDGLLISEGATIDESSLTGEPYGVDKIKGDIVRSGTINSGNQIIVKVTKSDKESTYRKIIQMVSEAQKEKAPLIRLADRYSTIFTLITLTICAFAFAISHDIQRVLAVLVIATPCPLILATPIALLGGMNAAAKQRVILKKLSSLEVLSRVNTIIFDKTGTITVGKPSVGKVDIFDSAFSQERVFSIASAIERSSLHPLAKGIVNKAKEINAPTAYAEKIEETIGKGIAGIVDGTRYYLTKVKDHIGMAIELTSDTSRIALFEFEDTMKEESKEIIAKLDKLGIHMYLFTGDKQVAADRVAAQMGSSITVRAECSPEDKKNGIEELKKQGRVCAMIGDGINDAPALALADVGMVFSNEEHTASTEAADVVFLGGDLASVIETISIAKYTIRISLQSITVGIGISIFGMLVAAFGYLPPVTGAFSQEILDIAVIFNALRTSIYNPKKKSN